MRTPRKLCESPGAAVTKGPKLGGLNSRNFSLGSGGWDSKLRELAGRLLLRAVRRARSVSPPVSGSLGHQLEDRHLPPVSSLCR